MYQEKILRFLDAYRGWEQDVTIGNPNDLVLNKLPGKVTNCFLFQRACNFDEMETEDDEQYIFSTPDYTVQSKLNRFQTRIILAQFGPHFDNARIDMIIKMAWNYPKIAIDHTNAKFEPYNDNRLSSLPPIPASGSPPIRTIFIED